MFRSFELLILESAYWFFNKPALFGVLVFGVPCIALFLIQIINRKKTVVPGLFAAGFALLLGYHLSAQHKVLRAIEEFVVLMQTPKQTKAIPLLEPFFEFLLAPHQYRFIVEETIAVGIVSYLGFFIYTSIKSYKKTGQIFGEISPTTLVNKKTRPQRSESNELGSGDLATTETIAKWTKPTGENADTSLAVSELRGSDGLAFKSANLVIPRGERNRHMLVVAKTGGGKTTKFILPVLYNDCMDPHRSTIVIDSKPEMWRKLARMTSHYNPDKHIMLFNPLDRARSLSWNILSKIEDDTDAKLIANTIIMATDNPQSKSDSPFFRNNALSVLNSVMVGLLNDPNEQLSMPRIHQLVQSGMKPLCDWIEQHPSALRTSKTFVELARSGSQNADTIMSELGMRLSAWDLSAIRATTMMDELDIEMLIERPSLFIVELRESELEMLRPMANVIVVEILRFLTKRAENCPGTTLPRPVSLVIDEFASALGRLPDIHVKLNTLRSRNVSIVAAIQSIAQVKANYADDSDSVLAGFSTKIFMPPLDLTDSEWASKETGQMTIRFQTASTGSNRKMIEFFASMNDSSQEQVQQRAVLTPDEIGKPHDNISTFFMPNTQAFQGHLVPFYKIPKMLKHITEFDNDEDELMLRAAPIKFDEDLEPSAAPGAAPGAAPAGPGGLPPGITNTAGWSEDKVKDTLEEVKKKLDWDNTTGSAKKWWEAFEDENKHRVALVLRLAEELQNRSATITEFFLAYVYSNTDNIQANLHYLDYTRLKKEEEKRKKETAAKEPETGTEEKIAANQ